MELTINEFSVGTLVRLDYKAQHGARVGLNFYNGRGDVVFHFNARHDENALVLNSCISGAWGREERPSGFPLRPGCDTHVCVMALDKGYRIFCNGKDFNYVFNHRKPISEICRISSTAGQFKIGKKLEDCQPGKVLYIEGIAPAHNQKFGLDLMNYRPWQMATFPLDYGSCGDIALHFNARFTEQPHVAVRNHKINNKWGKEERHGSMPIKPRENFIIAITWQQNGFEMAINGQHFGKFNYRCANNEVMTALFTGLASVNRIQFV